MSNKPRDPSKPKATIPRLNLRNPPTGISGSPSALFEHFSIHIIVEGPNQVSMRVVPHDQDPKAQKLKVPFDEVSKLARAAGFVNAQKKEEAKNENTDRARALFFNLAVDPAKVKEPKQFATELIKIQENIAKNSETIQNGGDDVQNSAYKDFAAKMMNRGVTAVESWAKARLEGKDDKLKDHYLKNGFPETLGTKLITGTLDVQGTAKFWTTFVGKEFSKFCQISLKEVREFPKGALKVFFPEAIRKEIEAISKDESLERMLTTKWAETPEKTKEEILSFSFPTRCPVSKYDVLVRMEQTKEVTRILDRDNHKYPFLAEWYNNMMREFYPVAPLVIPEVKAFWENEAGIALCDPSICSQSYRQQTIEALSSTQKNTPSLKLPSFKTSVKVNDQDLARASLVTAEMKMTDGSTMVAKSAKTFQEFKPPQLVGSNEGKKKRTQTQSRNSLVTESSKKHLLPVSKKIPPATMLKVVEYLRTFVNLKMQEIAAKVIAATWDDDENDAKKFLFEEEEKEEDEGPEANEEIEVEGEANLDELFSA